MDQTLNNIKKLRLQIDQLNKKSKLYDYILHTMEDEANDFPNEVVQFIESIPEAIINRIHQDLNSEFSVTPPSQSHKSAKARIGLAKGIRI